MSVEYSSEPVEHAREQLKALAQTPRTRFSKRAAIEALMEPLQAALRQHTDAEVATCLDACEIAITPGSLKQYVTRWQRQQSNLTAPDTGRERHKGDKAIGPEGVGPAVTGESLEWVHESVHESDLETASERDRSRQREPPETEKAVDVHPANKSNRPKQRRTLPTSESEIQLAY